MRIYRASSLGYSLEQLVAPHLGYDPVAPPEFLQKAYDEGTRLEPIIIEHLRTLGWGIYGEQTEVVIGIVPDEASIVGHVDGFVDEGENALVVEVKTMAHAAYLDWHKNGWESKSPLIEKYKWQASAYMIATGRQHVMVGWDKSAESVLSIHLATEPFYDLQTLVDKVMEAERCVEEGVLPEGCTDYPCPYWYLHANKERVPTATADEELDELLENWLALDKQEKSAKFQKGKFRELILAKSPDEALAGRITGSNGVTVSTTWIEAKHVEYDVKEHWETRIQGPRK